MGVPHKIMRSIVILFALLALLAVAAVVAEDVAAVEDDAEDDPAKQGKADLGEITEYMKKEFYGPEDIKEENLTAEQVTEKSGADAKEYLDELDKNKDTFLDLDEFTAHYKDDADDVDSELDEAGDEDAGDEDATEDEADADEE